MNKYLEFEQAPRKKIIFLIILLIIGITHLWNYTDAGISMFLAKSAVAAEEISFSQHNFNFLIYNNGYLSDYPLYALSLSVLQKFIQINDLTVQIPLIIALFFTSSLIWFTVSRAVGHLCGSVAAIIFLSFIPFSGNIIENGNLILATSLLTFAWIIFYRLSRVYSSRWIIIWGVALLPVFLAVFAIGLFAFIYFYLPLLLLRRPLKITLRIFQINHIIVFILYLIAAIFAWHFFMGNAYIIRDGIDNDSFFRTLGTFLGFSAPFFLMSWPIFCHSFHLTEKTPIFNYYIRTILSVSLLFSLFFTVRHEETLIVFPVLAIAIGVYYETFMRRHYLQIRRISSLFHIFAVLTTIFSWIILIIYHTGFNFYKNNVDELATPLLISTTILFLLIFCQKIRIIRLPFAIRFSIILCFLVITVHTLYEFLFEHKFSFNIETTEMKKTVKNKNNPQPTLVYLLDRNPPVEALFYLNFQFKKIRIADDLAENLNPEIYVLTNGDAPILENREWKLLNKFDYPKNRTEILSEKNTKTLALWEGKTRENSSLN